MNGGRSGKLQKRCLDFFVDLVSRRFKIFASAADSVAGSRRQGHGGEPESEYEFANHELSLSLAFGDHDPKNACCRERFLHHSCLPVIADMTVGF